MREYKKYSKQVIPTLFNRRNKPLCKFHFLIPINKNTFYL